MRVVERSGRRPRRRNGLSERSESKAPSDAATSLPLESKAPSAAATLLPLDSKATSDAAALLPLEVERLQQLVDGLLAFVAALLEHVCDVRAQMVLQQQAVQ